MNVRLSLALAPEARAQDADAAGCEAAGYERVSPYAAPGVDPNVGQVPSGRGANARGRDRRNLHVNLHKEPARLQAP